MLLMRSFFFEVRNKYLKILYECYQRINIHWNMHTHFFNRNNIIFADHQYVFFFSDLSLNIFLKYSYFSSSALLYTCIKRISHQKSCISNKMKHIEQSKDIFVWKQENDPAQLAEISFRNKNVLGKKENLLTKYFEVQKTTLGLYS